MLEFFSCMCPVCQKRLRIYLYNIMQMKWTYLSNIQDMISGSVVKIEGQSNTNAKMINANRAAIDYLEQKVNKGCQLENEKQSYQRNQGLQDKCQQLQEEKQTLEKKLAERQASQTTPLSDSNEERNTKHYSFQGKVFLPYK